MQQWLVVYPTSVSKRRGICKTGMVFQWPLFAEHMKADELSALSTASFGKTTDLKSTCYSFRLTSSVPDVNSATMFTVCKITPGS